MVPALKRMYQEEGEIGRKNSLNTLVYFTVIFTAIQGFSLLAILENQKVF